MEIGATDVAGWAREIEAARNLQESGGEERILATELTPPCGLSQQAGQGGSWRGVPGTLRLMALRLGSGMGFRQPQARTLSCSALLAPISWGTWG